MINTLDSLYNELNSKDIKSDITDLVLKYEEEYQDSNEELAKVAEEEREYLEREYIKSAI